MSMISGDVLLDMQESSSFVDSEGDSVYGHGGSKKPAEISFFGNVPQLMMLDDTSSWETSSVASESREGEDADHPLNQIIKLDAEKIASALHEEEVLQNQAREIFVIELADSSSLTSEEDIAAAFSSKSVSIKAEASPDKDEESRPFAEQATPTQPELEPLPSEPNVTSQAVNQEERGETKWCCW